MAKPVWIDVETMDVQRKELEQLLMLREDDQSKLWAVAGMLQDIVNHIRMDGHREVRLIAALPSLISPIPINEPSCPEEEEDDLPF
jgi:hypothetical protein